MTTGGELALATRAVRKSYGGPLVFAHNGTIPGVDAFGRGLVEVER